MNSISRTTHVVAFFFAALAFGCGSSVSSDGPSGGTGGSGGGSGTGSDSGLPCEVDAVLAAHCRSCHAAKPTAGAPFPLMTYDDLLAASKIDPTQTVAERSLARMKAAASPMPPPPAAPASADEITAFEAWITQGMPKGSCNGGTDPFDVPSECTSGQYWLLGELPSPNMHPGLACINCHTVNGEGEAPIFLLAGTVYPTAHEPDDCVGGPVDGTTKATIEVTDANGQLISMTANASGNFFYTAPAGAVVMPITAKVLYDGRERVMASAQSSGDCNSCHTQDGTQGAPGRILLP